MTRLTPDERDMRFIRRLAMLALALALVVFIYKITDLLLLVFGAAMVSVLLSAIADAIAEHGGLSRKTGFTIATVMLLGFLWLAGWLFTAQIGGEVEALKQQLPLAWQQVEARLAADPLGRPLLDAAREALGGSRLADWATWLGVGAGQLVVNFVIILVGALFIGAQPGLYKRGLVRMMPVRYRAVSRDALDDCGRTLRLWLVTQIVLMTTMGLLVGAGLWLAGLPTAAALGLLAGLSEFIPYVGPTLAMVPAIVLGAAGEGSVWGVLATYAVVRVIQTNFITPLVQRRIVSIPPAVTLFAILSFGYAFGTFGLFFSAPLLVVAYTLVGRLYLQETLGADVELPGDAGSRT